MSAARQVPCPTGEQYEIRYGDQSAIITQVGGALRAYRAGGREVIASFAASELSPAAHGAVLFPWPNRIGDGAYEFDGVRYQLDLTEPSRHNASHGLVRHTRWSLAGRDDASLTLGLDLVPRESYPWPLRARLRYALSGEGLAVTLRTENAGAAAAPFGAGFHPWLSPGEHPLDECTLHVEAGTWVRSDERLLPVEETGDIPPELDFRQPRRLGGTVLDDGFTGLFPGRSRVRLTDPDGVTVSCWAGESMAAWQLCTGDDLPPGRARSGLAAEPMTCTADAFRTGRRLIRLEPGEVHECRWGLVLERP